MMENETKSFKSYSGQQTKTRAEEKRREELPKGRAKTVENEEKERGKEGNLKQ